MNETKIERLRQIIYTQLDKHIDSDYCLLDVPAHENIGDNLIWMGELEYLKRLPHKMVYTSNLNLCNSRKVRKAGVILFHGGGNFGDTWDGFQSFRKKIIKKFPDKKIILFPQTAYYHNPQRIAQDASVFDSHPNLVLCARDEATFSLFKKNFKATILLVPDMAFCLNFRDLIDHTPKGRVLIQKRKDKELSRNFKESELIPLIDKGCQIDIADWPTFDNQEVVVQKTQPRSWFSFHKLALSKKVSRLPLLNRLVDDRYGFIFKKNHHLETYVDIGIRFINRYDIIFATRLHVLILSVLLDKKVYVLDNSYGKNSGLYNTWMKDFENVEMLDYSNIALSGNTTR